MRYDTPYWELSIYMALLGIGVGTMMQNLVLSTQNQVTPKDLGAASSTVSFFRSLGGAVGVGVLGSVMSGRITHYAKDTVASLDPQSQAAAAKAVGSSALPDMDALPSTVRTWLEGAYGHGIADVFLYAAPFALISFIVVMFIKEVPLRTSGGLAQAAEEAVGVLDAAEIPAPAEQKVPSWAAEGTEQQLAAVATVVGEETAPMSDPVSGGIPVRGFVRGAESAPVPQAAVTLISLGGRQLGRSVTQADGSYALDAPSVGSYVLIASADGFQPQASTVVVNGHEPVSYDVLLSGTSGLNGIVRAAETGLPVKDAMVIVTDVRGDLLSTGVTGEQGSSRSRSWCRGP